MMKIILILFKLLGNSWMSRSIKKALQTSIIHIERFQEVGQNRNTIIGPANLEIPDFPNQYAVRSRPGRPSVLLNNFGELMYCGDKICWVLRDGEWKIHSEFLIQRNYKVMVQMSNGIYAFGGWNPLSSHTVYENTSEFLPNESRQWQPGPVIPSDMDLMHKSAIAISKNELVLIGGYDYDIPGIGKILKFNTKTSKWTAI